ncbi:MAG: hypothetical protein LBU32_29475 [Clostridiales bacterium]|jgi:hypothetical protein|nr:hypothetical protein [Clostridiales bacterium]
MCRFIDTSGADEELFDAYSLTGRGKYGYSGKKILLHMDVLEEICRLAHDKLAC